MTNQQKRTAEWTYAASDVPIRVGDNVLVKWFLRRPLIGAVTFVHDLTRPSEPNGENDYGVTVRFDGRRGTSYRWYGGPGLPDNVSFLERTADCSNP